MDTFVAAILGLSLGEDTGSVKTHPGVRSASKPHGNIFFAQFFSNSYEFLLLPEMSKYKKWLKI